MNEGHVTPVPQEARAYQGQPAGLVTRLAAGSIDALVVVGALFLGYLGWSGLVFVFDSRRSDFPDPSVLTGTAATFVGLVLYLAVGWSLSGRTYGCHVMGVRVANGEGERPGPVAAAVRAVLCMVFPVGLLWCGISETRRSLQDLVVRTAVLYDWKPARRHTSQTR